MGRRAALLALALALRVVAAAAPPPSPEDDSGIPEAVAWSHPIGDPRFRGARLGAEAGAWTTAKRRARRWEAWARARWVARTGGTSRGGTSGRARTRTRPRRTRLRPCAWTASRRCCLRWRRTADGKMTTTTPPARTARTRLRRAATPRPPPGRVRGHVPRAVPAVLVRVRPGCDLGARRRRARADAVLAGPARAVPRGQPPGGGVPVHRANAGAGFSKSNGEKNGAKTNATRAVSLMFQFENPARTREVAPATSNGKTRLSDDAAAHAAFGCRETSSKKIRSSRRADSKTTTTKTPGVPHKGAHMYTKRAVDGDPRASPSVSEPWHGGFAVAAAEADGARVTVTPLCFRARRR